MTLEPSLLERNWRRSIEDYLLSIPGEESARLIQLMRESRAAWVLMLPPASGARRALFLGDARSGTPAGLVRLGWRVTVQDPTTREFAIHRGAATRAPVDDGTQANESTAAASDPGKSDPSKSDLGASGSILAVESATTGFEAPAQNEPGGEPIPPPVDPASDRNQASSATPPDVATTSTRNSKGATPSQSTFDWSAKAPMSDEANGPTSDTASEPTSEAASVPSNELPGEAAAPGTRRPPPIHPVDRAESALVSEKSAETDSFDLVLIEDDSLASPISLPMAVSLSNDLIALTVDNPLGYKRSSGYRADFKRATPTALGHAWLHERDQLLPARRQRLSSLSGQPARAVALYPDRRDFAHVVDWERGAPDLTLGPAERKNGLKLLGRKLGLFPVLAPSFGLWSSKLGSTQTLLDALLDGIAKHLGAERQRPLHLVATRGNSALVLTRDWVVRIPLGHRPNAAMQQNAAGLLALQALDLPTPEPLYLGPIRAGQVDVLLSVESRIPGLGAGQLVDKPKAVARLAATLATRLAALPRTPAQTLDANAAHTLFAPRFQAVKERCGDAATAAALDHMQAETIARATGLTLPLIACHRDLRPKHVIIDEQGRGELMGVVDWSCLEQTGPPLYDLFHFLAQERTARKEWNASRVWHAFQDRNQLEPHEQSAIAHYEAALGLPPEWYAVIAGAYPVLFGAMAEEHWDFSRPLWIKRMFGIE